MAHGFSSGYTSEIRDKKVPPKKACLRSVLAPDGIDVEFTYHPFVFRSENGDRLAQAFVLFDKLKLKVERFSAICCRKYE